MFPKHFTQRNNEVQHHYKQSKARSQKPENSSRIVWLRDTLLWATLAFSSLLMSASPSAPPLPGFPVNLSEWGLPDHPDMLRFGVLTQSEKAIYLSRLSKIIPQRPQALPPAFQDKSIALAANPQGAFALGPHPMTVSHAVGKFQKSPTHAEISLNQDQIELTVDQQKGGYGGTWINLSALATGQTGFLDVRHYHYLSFWVQSHGQFRLKLADRHWFKKEDALDLGILAHFYSPFVSGQSNWRQVIIPLDHLKQSQNLDHASIANLVLQADPGESGSHHLLLRALTLHQQLPQNTPPFAVSPEPTASTNPSTDRPSPRQLYHTWIWNTEYLLSAPNTWESLISQLKTLSIGEVYLQWPGDQNTGILADLIKTFHTAKISVHALDGAPYFAKAHHHQEVFNTLDTLAQFQKSQPQVSRFDGIHYDIEPYLLPGFFGAHQQEISTSYLTLVKAIHQRAQALEIPFGLALPFWLDMPDEFTGKALLVEQDGINAPLYEHLQRNSDYIALMDYKTQLLGQGGIIESAQNELNFARQHQKKVIIGLETMELPDEQLFTFEGSPRRQQPSTSANSVVFYQAAGAPTDVNTESQWRAYFVKAGTALPTAISTAQHRWFWPLIPYAQVKSEQLSFAKKGPEALTDILQGAENTLGQDPAFGGIALHHSESLFALMAKTKNQFHSTSKGDPCGLTSVFAFNQPSKVLSR